MRAPALAIAHYVRNRDGAASSAEILERFGVCHSTLKRRRPELRWLGIVYVEDGNRSFFATEELISQVPPTTEQVSSNGAVSARARERA